MTKTGQHTVSEEIVKGLDHATFSIVKQCLSGCFPRHYGTSKKFSMKWLLTPGPSLGIVRVPGIGLIYTDPSSHKPPGVSPSPRLRLHQVRAGASRSTAIGRIGPKEYRMYRCIRRYGYKDLHQDDQDFERIIQMEDAHPWTPSSTEVSVDGRMTVVELRSARGGKTGGGGAPSAGQQEEGEVRKGRRPS
ncbi:hypothetical protein SELMODRAFT_418240 [Selaginella moellendorffii]|uniref:Uncharacterized protein n=1 Tax=Selaginella moellendorffii TaxID=88036 RepID=D8S541_SELML|nr:hypothetical protein SELMODRAFT_418240 [Selaginella moellendorffii]